MSKDLIKELKRYQKDRGFSHQELAKDIGVSLITLRRWLSREGKPSHLAEVRIMTVMEKKKNKKLFQNVGKGTNRLKHLVKLANKNGLKFSKKARKQVGKIIINLGARWEQWKPLLQILRRKAKNYSQFPRIKTEKWKAMARHKRKGE